MSSSMLVHIAETLDKEIEQHRDALAGGALRTFEEYKWQTGVIRGLLKAKGMLVDIAERLDRQDD